ncbi:hypothetical protein PV327_010405 [Microctonus hyperodae]|uniref:SREBP regulating gene protein n=1 Tax=Microctonus hyperodae TaxID=165561 RepID=A0AA39KUW5_MICHY|nr:hypothetical protein PV327_010405 [Microctonus hyperodae]
MLLSWGSIVRVLRKRIVLAIIFGLSFTYCAISLLARERIASHIVTYDDDDDGDDNMTIDNEDLPLDDDIDDETLGKNFPWLISGPDDGNGDTANMQAQINVNSSDEFPKNCRNSIQGKSLIVDERGYVCARQDVLPMGCCKEHQDITSENNDKTIVKRERYSCETCNAQGCCAIYEYCVSCCLHPGRQRKPKKDNQGGKVRRENQKTKKIEDVVKLRFRSLDKFQICLAICRTSSASVRHENTYKDPHSKHCYYNSPGNILHQRTERDLISSNNNKGDNVAITSFSTVSLIIPIN